MTHLRRLAAFGLATTLLGCASTAPPVPSLAGTRWHIEAFQSMDDAQGTLRPQDPTRWTLAFGADGRAVLRLDCNRGTATWQAQPAATSTAARASGQLQLGPLATTRAQCPEEAMTQRLLKSWPYLRSYVIEGGRLHLSLVADGGIVTWAPAP